MDTKIIKFASLILLYLYFQHHDKFFTVNYYDLETHEYGKGPQDTCIVIVSLLVQLLLRSVVIKSTPFVFKLLQNLQDKYKIAHGQTATKIISFEKYQRFGEQLWLLLYYCFVISYGTVLYWNSDYFYDASLTFPSNGQYPQKYPTVYMKLYYLIQISCWFQQLITLHLEAKRKDYVEMLSHHLITIFLTIGSYHYSVWGMGHLIMLIMDIVDIFLISSKLLNYLNFRSLCNFMFGLFILNWVFFRHFVYNYLTWVTWRYIPLNVTICSAAPPASSDFASLRYIPADNDSCMSSIFYKSLITALVSLQVLQVIWLWMIIKLLLKLLKATDKSEVTDSRSDDESDEKIDLLTEPFSEKPLAL